MGSLFLITLLALLIQSGILYLVVKSALSNTNKELKEISETNKLILESVKSKEVERFLKLKELEVLYNEKIYKINTTISSTQKERDKKIEQANKEYEEQKNKIKSDI